jgi:hypothetical protein
LILGETEYCVQIFLLPVAYPVATRPHGEHSMKKFMVVLTLVGMLSGCTSQGQQKSVSQVKTVPQEQSSEYKQAHYLCYRDAAPAVNVFVRNKLYKACMEAKLAAVKPDASTQEQNRSLAEAQKHREGMIYTCKISNGCNFIQKDGIEHFIMTVSDLDLQTDKDAKIRMIVLYCSDTKLLGRVTQFHFQRGNEITHLDCRNDIADQFSILEQLN